MITIEIQRISGVWEKNLNKILILFAILSFGTTSLVENAVAEEETAVPSWIKITALWWGEDKINDQDFITALQYLVNNKILVIPELEIELETDCPPGTILDIVAGECVIPEEPPASSEVFPDFLETQKKIVISWIKITALWWGEDKINDQDFITALQYLVENEILLIPEPETEQESQTQLVPFLQLESIPNIVTSWTNIDRIDDFRVEGHGSGDSYNLRFKIISVYEKDIAADGTISIVMMDTKNRILYLDAFSVRKGDFATIFEAFSGKEVTVYNWEIPVLDVKKGYGTLGTSKLVFTDRDGNSFSNEFNSVSIPQFN